MINIFLLIAFGRLLHRTVGVVTESSRARSEKTTVLYVLFWLLPLFIYTLVKYNEGYSLETIEEKDYNEENANPILIVHYVYYILLIPIFIINGLIIGITVLTFVFRIYSYSDKSYRR